MSKTNITYKEVIHLAKLAGLNLTDKQIEDIRKKLSETLDYVDNLNQLNTESVIPTSQTTGLVNIFFKDGEENKRGLTSEEALSGVRSKKDSLFTVRTIKQNNI